MPHLSRHVLTASVSIARGFVRELRSQDTSDAALSLRGSVEQREIYRRMRSRYSLYDPIGRKGEYGSTVLS
jgi:hypothetical protein